MALQRLTEPLPVIFSLRAPKPARNIQIFGYVGGCNELADILETGTGRLRILAGQGFNLSADCGVVTQHVTGGPCDMSAWVSPTVECDSECDAPMLPSLPEPRPEGGPPAG